MAQWVNSGGVLYSSCIPVIPRGAPRAGGSTHDPSHPSSYTEQDPRTQDADHYLVISGPSFGLLCEDRLQGLAECRPSTFDMFGKPCSKARNQASPSR